MDFFDLVLLAVVQGITEFLPISSYAHLILAREVLGLDLKEFVVIDIAVHFGSLFAVVAFFWSDIKLAIIGPFVLIEDLRARRPLSWPSKLALLLIVATIPVVLFALALISMGSVEEMRTLEIIGWTTLIYGVLLYVADRYFPSDQELKDWNLGSAIWMGMAQALALIPGTSRSGVTMTMGRFLGFDRREAARIALLMAVPAILAASAKGVYDLIEQGDAQLTLDAVIAAVLAAVTAYAAISVMMRWLAHASFTPFVIYRVVLGCVLLWAAYVGF